jgi:hypothetical protein
LSEYRYEYTSAISVVMAEAEAEAATTLISRGLVRTLVAFYYVTGLSNFVDFWLELALFIAGTTVLWVVCRRIFRWTFAIKLPPIPEHSEGEEEDDEAWHLKHVAADALDNPENLDKRLRAEFAAATYLAERRLRRAHAEANRVPRTRDEAE